MASMTFLELCQMTARESGVLSGTVPTAVTGQVGRLLKVVKWTAEAYNQIQNLRPNWLWLRTEFTGDTTSGTGEYTAASWNLARFRGWIGDYMEEGVKIYPNSIYLTATGVSDENALVEITWSTYRTCYKRGTQTNARPGEYAFSPALEFCLGAIPNDTFTISGEYGKGNQTLAANGDVPEMPAQFHEMIPWKAVQLLNEHDEAGALPIAGAQDKFTSYLQWLEREQLPPITLGGGPLA